MSEPQPKYTTAIIAAVPAADDPVNEHVIEDAHVTLQFLGEASSLDDAQIEEIKSSLELMASNLYPFPADVAGTAELGPDKAKVLLVQSDPLTKLRDLLSTVPAVSTAVAASKQFPNWIPHLTLAYGDDGSQVAAPGIESVTIGSLELWLGDDHAAVYPMAKAAPSVVEEETVTAAVVVTAAGLKQFDENLHPRGRDGRFIEKFGVIKYLTATGWAYGKVDGIYADPSSGETKLTITPSDLAGKPSGADSIVMVPKQVYRAPKPKAHLTISDAGVKKIGGQAGSNQGGLYEIPSAANTQGGQPGKPEKYYVKKPQTINHGRNEALANAFYEEAGVPVPEVDLHGGDLYSKIVEGKQDMAQQLNNPEWTDQVRRNFAVDAWLGNRDVFGLTYDNILTDPDGVPWRIDNGGALLYRAMGAKKDDFGGSVTELDVFRTGKKAKIFGAGMTKAQEIDGAERVLAILPSRIDDMVQEHGLPKSLADTLKARRQYIANYYGLPLPESQQAPEAQPGSTAPKVDAADIASNKGKGRVWFKNSLSSGTFVLQEGDLVEFPDGSTAMYGVSEDGNQSPLSILGAQQQLLGWQQKHGADADVMIKKSIDPTAARPDHGAKVSGGDLSKQRWRRGDKLISSDGTQHKILGWNDDTGAVLIQNGDNPPQLLDTFGADSTGVWTVQRWDPPAAEKLDEVAPATQDTALTDSLNNLGGPPSQETVDDLGSFNLNEPAPTPAEAPQVLAPAPGKTGQAAVAETAIKADLEQPLPEGKGTPPPAKTQAPGGAKQMLLGDGTTAATGDEVVSKKDGKTYVFVKPKGQYAVVTDPNGDDPQKQLLKLASTMTQPDKAPAADVSVEAPKTATGEVPALGMMAVAKDGWAGEITLISPDGKFVFITDANGKRKRKSTGTVSITSAPVQPGPVDTEKTDSPGPSPVPGPIKAYGQPPKAADAKEAVGSLDWDDPADLGPDDMAVVGYADGSIGLEPYTGQDGVLTNANGKVATHNTIRIYQGPIAAEHMVKATGATGNDTMYEVIWNGTYGYTDGSTGPSGGLMIWGEENGAPDSTYAFELPPTGQVLNIVGSDPQNNPLVLPTGVGLDAWDGSEGGLWNTPLPVLYGEEAKTLKGWQGQLAQGSKISLDGQNWLTVTHAYPTGALDVQDGNGAKTTLLASSLATFVVKAPEMSDGDAVSEKFSAEPMPQVVPAVDITEAPANQMKLADGVKGDVILVPGGDIEVIDYVEESANEEFNLVTFGAPDGEHVTASMTTEKLGNIYDGPVVVPAGLVASKLYPGVILQPGTDTKLTAVTYPAMKGDGGFQLAVMHNDDPEHVSLLKIGGEGADLGEDAVLPVHFAQQTHADALGVDTAKVDALFSASILKPDNPVDHHWEMNNQGLDFGKAKYPIYDFPTPSGGHAYLRNGPTGLEEWDTEDSQWIAVATGSTIGLEKVWDGVPFQGKLSVPENLAGMPSLMDESVLDYTPEPGELVEFISLDVAGTKKWALVVYPSGNPDGPAHTVMPASATTGEPAHKSAEPFAGDWKENAAFGDFTVAHDPFSDAPVKPEITHHTGMAPVELMQRMTVLGHTPQPGVTYLAAVTPEGQMAVLAKQPDGTYKKLMSQGSVGVKTWTLDEVQDPGKAGSDTTFFTWTAPTPEGVDAPQPIEGLPAGYAPFIPSEGQSVVKQTLGNGKESVYVQNAPGGGWYLLGPDGTVDESSDAIKSDHIVQAKLKGKGSNQVKLSLLHPAPEGTADPGSAVPTFTNAQGEWTPQPGQKVVGLYSSPDDPDPWFYVQEAPGEKWQPAPTTPTKGGMEDSAMQHALSTQGSAYKLVFDGAQGVVDTTETPSFFHHKPLPGTSVYKDESGDFWAQKEPGGKYYYVKPDGGYSVGGLDQNDIDLDNQILVWPNAQPTPSTVPADQDKGTFAGYTPVAGDTIISYTSSADQTVTYLVKKQGAKNWYEISPATGKPGTIPIYDSEVPNNLGPEHGNDYAHVWPPEQSPAGTETATFSGYTPQPGQKVLAIGQPGSESYYVQSEPGGKWQEINDAGQLVGNGVSDTMVQGELANNDGSMRIVWSGSDESAAGPAGVFAGYQSLAGESVIEAAGPTQTLTLVKKDDGNWYSIENGVPNMAAPLGQGAIDWLGSAEGNVNITVLQGSMKDDATPEPLDVSTGKYAGVAAPTTITPGSYTVEGNVELSAYVQGKIHGLELQPGESLWIGGTQAYVRTSEGKYYEVHGGGKHFQASYLSDQEFEALYSADYPAYKVSFTAPQAAPAAPAATGLAADMPISGWQQHNLPDPATFGTAGTGGEALVGTPAGTWVYVPSPVDKNRGLFLELAEDYTDATQSMKVKSWVLVKDGTATEKKYPTLGQESISLGVSDLSTYYIQGYTGPAVAKPQAAAQAPEKPAGMPDYPGAQKPSQEDINAWGGELTKDGYIPTAGMFVTGKGPMQGKVISVSKDKTKATVLTSDGKKTTRLISALKTDKTANYQAYAAPVTLKDVPQGMPLAVDTVAEALDKTVKDGKFRAILTGHPGVSGGQMTVTKATGPSGKAYNRLHLTLTPEQLNQLSGLLSGTGEKGDWVTGAKMSEQVAVGDLLPMRKSSTNNPDGTPRWKVDSSLVPPTHEVVGVTDDPAGNGIKLVTLKDRTTGEEITSRFHPGKSLTTYTWDPDKPKVMTAGDISLSEIAKADGWTYTTDGGISAAKGGADNALLHNEPGTPVSKSAFQDAGHSWKTLRNVSANGVVIEVVAPKGPSKNSTTGATVISVPEGVDEQGLQAALARMGIDYSPMTQDSAKDNVRGALRTLLHLDINDVDTAKGWTDDKLFSEAGKVMGISDLGWQDVLVGVDESTGKTSFFWSDRARTALANKAGYNLVYRAATNASASQIVSTVKYGSANSVLKRTTGMVDGSSGQGGGASWSSDQGNHAGHGSYASASKETKLPASNKWATYKTPGMMIYHRPEAVLGRIMDIRVASNDAFGMGKGQGANHLAEATSMGSIRDYFLGGGLPTEAVGFIAVSSAGERDAAIKKLKEDGFGVINGRPVEDIIITKQKAATLKPDDLPPVTLPANARPILDLPTSYDAPAAPSVTASGEGEQDDDTTPAPVEEVA